MASELAKLLESIAKMSVRHGVIDDNCATMMDNELFIVREALSDTNRCVAHELYPAMIDKVRLALATLDPK